jgi:hypothetical protein
MVHKTVENHLVFVVYYKTNPAWSLRFTAKLVRLSFENQLVFGKNGTYLL